jgi:hypothetical protein
LASAACCIVGSAIASSSTPKYVAAVSSHRAASPRRSRSRPRSATVGSSALRMSAAGVLAATAAQRSAIESSSP